MDRRDALRTLGGLSALGALSPRELLALGQELHERVAASEERTIFLRLDPHQSELVATLAEAIVPATDTPGAREAGVAAFVDRALDAWMTADERARFLAGLARLDDEARRRHGADFLALDAAARRALLEAQEEAARAERPPGPAEVGAPRLDRWHFFDVMKWLTLVGYYTSRVGMEQEIGYEVFPVSYSGCAPFDRG